MTIQKGLIGRQDFKNWDGGDVKFSRRTSTGGTVSLYAVGNEIDVAAIYCPDYTDFNGGDIQEAINGASGNASTLVLAPGSWSITSNLTIPSTAVLRVPKGAVLSIASGITLTFSGGLDAGPYQVFSGDGAVSFGAGVVDEAYVEWWGVNTAAFASAVAAIGNSGIPLQLLAKTYTANIVLNSRNSFNLRGCGVGTKITPASGKAVDVASCNDLRISEMWLYGGSYGLYINGASWGIVANLRIENASVDGLYFQGDGSTETTFDNVQITNSGEVGFHMYRSTGTDTGGAFLKNVKVYKGSSADGKGFVFESVHGGGTAIYLWGETIIADGFAKEAIVFDTITNFRFHKVWATGTNAGSRMVHLHDCAQGKIIDLWCQNAADDGDAVEIDNCTAIHLDNLDLLPGASGYGLRITNRGVATQQLGKYVLYYGTLTNDYEAFLASRTINPLTVLAYGGTPAGLEIMDVEKPLSFPTKTMTVNDGSLNFVNHAKDATIVSFPDAGGVVVYGDSGFGIDGAVVYTGETNAEANSSGVGTVTMKGASNRVSTVFIKVWVNSTTYVWVPGFETITG